MRRRQFLALVSGVVAWPRNAHSQTLTKVNRFGLLDPARPLSANRPDATTLLTALASRGYTLGQILPTMRARRAATTRSFRTFGRTSRRAVSM
jgi:hypothetical protein